MTMIVKMFQVDIQIDQEAHKIVLRNPAGQELDITNCVQRHEVDIDGTAYLSVVATTRKCSYKAEPKEMARTCSLHPDQPVVFRRGIQCRCGETVITLALCQWCRDHLSEEAQAELSDRHYEAGCELHKSGQVHQEWAARLRPLAWRTGKEFFSAPCPFCEYEIRDVWGAATSDGTEVVCPGCGKTSKIVRIDGGLEVVQ